MWNKGAAGGLAATRAVEEELPFALLGFDCDHGSEFLNHHLLAYQHERKKRAGRGTSCPPAAGLPAAQDPMYLSDIGIMGCRF